MSEINYRFLDHTADIAVEVKGRTLEDLFLSSAAAFKETVLEPFRPEKEHSGQITISEATLEELLVGFLSELNYFLLVKKLAVYSINSLEISSHVSGLQLKAEITMEPVDEYRHILKEEIKAVTFHKMNIEKTGDGFVTIVVFDI